MEARQITNRFPATCRGCGGSIPKGTSVWFKKGNGVRCRQCGPHEGYVPPPAEPPKPKPTPRKRTRRKTTTPKPKPTPSGKRDVYAHWTCTSDVLDEALSFGTGVADNLEWFDSYIQNEILSGRRKWANYHTLETLTDASRSTPKYLEEIEQYKREIETEAFEYTKPMPRRRLARGLEHGDEIEVDRYMMRNPNMWMRMTRELKPQRVVNIGINIGVAWDVTQDELLARGAACLALVDVLTTRGYSVGVKMFSASYDASTETNWCIKTLDLKRPEMPLDTASLSLAMCDIGFYRCGMLVASLRRCPGTIHDSFGHTRPVPEKYRKDIDFFIEQNVKSRSKAVEWLRDCFESTVLQAASA